MGLAAYIKNNVTYVEYTTYNEEDESFADNFGTSLKRWYTERAAQREGNVIKSLWDTQDHRAWLASTYGEASYLPYAVTLIKSMYGDMGIQVNYETPLSMYINTFEAHNEGDNGFVWKARAAYAVLHHVATADTMTVYSLTYRALDSVDYRDQFLRWDSALWGQYKNILRRNNV